MRSRFSQIDGYGTVFFFPTNLDGYHALHDLTDTALRNTVLWAFADSFRVSRRDDLTPSYRASPHLTSPPFPSLHSNSPQLAHLCTIHHSDHPC
jgi:hypothetical protein